MKCYYITVKRSPVKATVYISMCFYTGKANHYLLAFCFELQMILTNYLFLGKTVSKQTNMKRSHAQKGGRLQLNQSTHA